MISVIDDDEAVRNSMVSLLRSYGYETEAFATAEAFLDSGRLNETGCILLDVNMPGMDGLRLQRNLSDLRSTVPVVFVSAQDDTITRRRVIGAGAAGFLKKPLNSAALIAKIKAVLPQRDCGNNTPAPPETPGV
jgi:FixJ family two-component response regulator